MSTSSNPNGLRTVLPNAGGGFAVQGAEILAGTIVDGHLAAGTITAASIASGTITGTQIASATVADSNMVANTLTSASIAKNVIQTVSVPLNAAAIKTLYSAPTQIIAAPGAGLAIVVLGAVAVFSQSGAQYASGGAVQLQYDSTVHAGGTTPLTTVAAGVIQAASSSNTQMQTAGSSTTIVANKGIYASAATADFTTGTAGTLTFVVTYQIITAV